MGREVGLPIDPPRRNVNSRFALETAELVRAQNGDNAAGAFYHGVSRAFFTEHADISTRDAIVPIAESSASGYNVETAWRERRFSPRVNAFIEVARMAGVSGVPGNGVAAPPRDRRYDEAGRSRRSTSQRGAGRGGARPEY